MFFPKKMSVRGKSLREKLWIVFSLMSVIPLLILIYFVTDYIFPSGMSNPVQIVLIVIFTALVSLAGYLLAREIIMPVVDLALETRIIASGQYDAKISVSTDDELGEIAASVNNMTGQIRDYMMQLKEYNKKTATLNSIIHRKVLTLTNLMKLGDLISSAAAFPEVANFATESMAGEMYGGFCAIFIKGKGGAYFLESLYNNSGREIDANEIKEWLPSAEKNFLKEEYLLVDSRPHVKHWQEELCEKMKQMNAIMFPLRSGAEIFGVFMFGNFIEGVEFDSEDIEVLRSFGKELILGYQSSQAIARVKELEVRDALTGLYTFPHLEKLLDEEITRAVYYQRPCSFILVNVDGFEEYSNSYGVAKAHEVLKKIGKILSAVVPQVGKVGRTDMDEFGMLLPEKNKREALEMAENVRRLIEEMKAPGSGERAVTVSIGVSENPIDGATSDDIIVRARQYLARAKEQGENRVVGE
ncbi:MAG: diguanylate cyclase [Candidatus Omnitrophota bacterium]